MRRFCLLLTVPLLLALPASAARAQDETPDAPEEAKPLVTIESVEVRPPEGRSLGPETLARLTVKIANRGEKTASALAFTVTVAGHDLPVYDRQVFLKSIPAGETTELALYNFWTGETGRPAPAGGKLEVEVTLREARWMEVSEEDGAEVWTPVGEVEDLPSSASTTVQLGSGS